jgi:hypothetical protein
MMTEAARSDTAGLALDPLPGSGDPADKAHLRFDLANYKEQRYDDTVICTYTALISRGTAAGVRVISYNETRVIVKQGGAWKVAHVHRSPSWPAPFQPPAMDRFASP